MLELEDVLGEIIAAELFKHRRDGNRCVCGWTMVPLLDSAMRVHQAEQILPAVLMAVAQVRGDQVADAKARTHAVGRLLIDSGDMTPMGARILDKIWEPTARNAL